MLKTKQQHSNKSNILAEWNYDHIIPCVTPIVRCRSDPDRQIRRIEVKSHTNNNNNKKLPRKFN
jgi:hypothetical protein